MSVQHREPTDGMQPSDGFVGREPELDRVVTLLLRRARLITLIGPGGIGKTRLAAEAARRIQRSHNTPVRWVRLARLSPGCGLDAVEEAAASAVIDTDYSGRSSWETLIDTVTEVDARGHRVQSVLVIDNCEHVLYEAGEFIARLLAAVPALTIVATSRQAIGWVDEHLVPVPPLTRAQALTLFRLRAELTEHSVVDAEDLATAQLICQHMDHNPLYIRLAAGRLVRQPLAVIAQPPTDRASVDPRLRWAHGPVVGAEKRHRGISDAIAWSYTLCQDKEKLLFDRMSVFAAGYDINPEDQDDSALDVGAELAAIEAICADGDDRDGRPYLDREEIEELLDSLASQSLVSRHITQTTVRYSLLENFRLFAQARLSERSTVEFDEPARLAERHRIYYRDKVVAAAARYFSPAEQELLDWARAAWANILTAIEGSLSAPSTAVTGLEICVGLLTLRLSFFKGSFREMRRWTERTLDVSREVSPPPVDLQIAATALLVWITLCQGCTDEAEAMLDDAVSMCVSDLHADWRESPEKDRQLPAPVDFAWGVELMLAQRDPAAVTVLGRARTKFDQLGEEGGSAMSELFAALAAGLLGTTDQACELAQRYLARAEASGGAWVLSWAQLTWSIALTRRGDIDTALTLQRTALAHQTATRDRWGGLWAVEFRAWTLARIITDRTDAARPDSRELSSLATEIAQLAGGTRTLRARIGVEISQLGPFADAAAVALKVARNVLGDRRFEAAEASGAALRPEHNEVQQLALGTLAQGTLTRPVLADPTLWQSLTAAEQEVALLAAAGWTNAAIAARRGKSRRTVDAQLAMTFQKLDITSRADIVQFVPEEHSSQVRAETRLRTSQPNTH
ncbi:ATP-binding protein [Nocardia brasiliensis]|uniref:ATP-binding protein n=1 Tax=Nocardia brasiliensis TaxID=37326 RepID=UPI002458F2D8|nr:LuxR C-terminal-related transcriptional regulator [Nocardia brasiliensis]